VESINSSQRVLRYFKAKRQPRKRSQRQNFRPEVETVNMRSSRATILHCSKGSDIDDVRYKNISISVEQY
jgi:hypothetical protein